MIGRFSWVGLAILAVLPGLLCAQNPGEDLWPARENEQVRRLPPIEQIATGPIEGLPPPPAADTSILPEPPPLTEEIPVSPKPPKLWEGSFEMGLNGTEGNSRTLNFRFGLDAKRKTPRDVFSMDLNYHQNTSNFVKNANRLYFDWRYEWLIEDSLWTLFVHGTDDYDEFRPYDFRVTADAGVGRKFIDTDETTFLGRFGAGFAREIGGLDDDYVPQLNFGLDLSHKLSKRQKLAATVEYAPEVTDFEDCRINSKFSWEVLLDEEANLSLKACIRDRFDSFPEDGEPNDLDYSTVLMYRF